MKTTINVPGVAALLLLLLISDSDAFSVSPSSRTTNHHRHQNFVLASSLINEDLKTISRQRERTSALSAFTTADEVELIGASSSISSTLTNKVDKVMENISGLKSVLTTALLVTSSTIGAGALVLPELALKPGLAISTGLFVAAFLVNLISGLVIAEIAIKQHESSGSDVPSSFKDFANANLEGDSAGDVVAGICIMTNVCLVAFGLDCAGTICANLLNIDPSVATPAYAAVLAVMIGTLSGETMSMVASATVMALFCSFFGLLIPGLATLQDPIATIMAPGTSSDIWAGISEVFPIFLISLVYQNIVPSVTKILEYDRTKTIASLTLGSFLPLLLTVAWCLCAGSDGASAGPLLTIFSLTAATGSSIGCAMSIAEEVDSYVSTFEAKNDPDYTFTPLAVVGAVAVPLVAAMTCTGGDDFLLALKVAGSYGSPLLYGGIPAWMAFTQRDKLSNNILTDLVPGGASTLAALGAASAGFMLHEVSTDLPGFF